MDSVGILHPGAMGAAVAASVRNSGCEVYWASEGRRPQSRERAEAASLRDAGTVQALCAQCPVVISVCPPEFAEQLALQVIEAGFRGAYLDANALAPARKLSMAARMESAGIRFVDGGVIGLPPTGHGETWICLSGAEAPKIAEYFLNGPISAEVVGAAVGRASAIKMCFAAHNKGAIALRAAILAAARHHGVLEDLKRQWTRRGPALPQVEKEIQRAAPKAWRWEPEMREIADTLEAAGLPGDFHAGAAEIYRRLVGFKDAADPSVQEVLDRLLGDKS